MHLLEVDSVLYGHDSELLLSNIYMKCHTNQVVGLIGRNGSGKSSLFKVIFGIAHAENKNIRIDGTPIKTFSDLSYLPQHPFIPPFISVKKAIGLFPLVSTDPVRLHLIIRPLLGSLVRDISSGEQRILETLIILNSKAKFALLDEPFRGLSPILQDELKSIINACKRRKGIIVTDHNYRSILDVSDEFYFLSGGKLHYLESKNDIEKFSYLP